MKIKFKRKKKKIYDIYCEKCKCVKIHQDHSSFMRGICEDCKKLNEFFEFERRFG